MSPVATGATRSEEILRGAERVLAPTYARPDLVFVEGRGTWLTEAGGDRYLDFTSGICVNALGHSPPEVVEAIREGADGLIHTSNLYHTEPAVQLAADLVRRSFADRAFFSNSGAEANEAAIKFARLAGGPRRRTIVSFTGSFHGRTLGTLPATDRPEYRDPFTPVAGGFRSAKWNTEHDLQQIDESTAAAIVEPIQGEAGVRVPREEWLHALRRRCRDTGTYLIFDEVQTGLGRCGHLWAHEGFGVTPDIMTLAKPLAGGLPIGATLITEEVAGAIRAGCHATTFGGGPLVTRVARTVLSVVAGGGFLEDVRTKGESLCQALAGLGSPLVEEIRGRGLLIGVRVRRHRELLSVALDEKLLLVPAGDQVLRFVPPLNVSPGELLEATERFRRALVRVEKRGGAS